MNQSINQSINQPTNQSINQSTNQSINQSINQPTDQPIVNPSILQSINPSINHQQRQQLLPVLPTTTTTTTTTASSSSSFPKTRMIGSDQIHQLQLEIGDFWPWWSLMWKVEDHTGTCQDHHLGPKNLQGWRQMMEKLKTVVYIQL